MRSDSVKVVYLRLLPKTNSMGMAVYNRLIKRQLEVTNTWFGVQCSIFVTVILI